MDPFIYRECRATITARIPDTPDADQHPDRVLVQGRGTAHPQFQGGSVVFTEIGEYAIPQPVPVVIVDGELLVEVLSGDESVETQPLFLPVTVDERANQNWSWRLTFDFLTLGEYGEEVSHPPLSFPVEDGDGPLEISTVATPVIKSQGFVTRGAPGAGLQEITAENGELVFQWDNGRTASVPVPDTVEGPPGPMVDVTAGTVEVGATPIDFGVSVTGEGETRQINVTLPKPEKGDPGPPGEGATDPEIAAKIADSSTSTHGAVKSLIPSGTGLNVLDFGAAGDGITDDTAAIQAALDTGDDVYIPSGFTFTTTGVELTADGQTLHGPGTLRLADETWSPVVAATGLDRVHVGVTIDGNAVGNPLDNGEYTWAGVVVSSPDQGCVRLDNCTHSTVTAQVSLAHASPVVLYQCSSSKIVGSVSVNHRREGYGLIGGDNCEVLTSIAYNNTGSHRPWSLVFTTGFEGDAPHRHRIAGNYCADSQAAHITVNTMNTIVEDNTVIKTGGMEITNGPGIRLGHNLPGRSAAGCIVRRNTVTGIRATNPLGGSPGNRAISCDNATGSVITGNTIQNCWSGVGVSTVSGQVIDTTNNIMRGIDARAVDYFSCSGKVMQNTIDSCATGIHFQGVGDGSVVSDNVVSGASSAGVSVRFGGGSLGGIRVHGNRVFRGGASSENYVLDGVSGYGLLVSNQGYADGDSAALRIETFGTAAPTTGYWKRGSKVWSTNVEAGTTLGWVCVADGTPGTWVAMPVVSV